MLTDFQQNIMAYVVILTINQNIKGPIFHVIFIMLKSQLVQITFLVQKTFDAHLLNLKSLCSNLTSIWPCPDNCFHRNLQRPEHLSQVSNDALTWHCTKLFYHEKPQQVRI